MKVTKVTIRNFMPFYKEVPVNLQTDSEAPLVLIGGKNDRGKTAFFNALKFGLYGFEGSNADKARKRRRVINRQAAVDGLQETSVTIEFTHNETVYELKRVIEFDQVDDPDERESDGSYVEVTKPSVSEDEEVVVSRSDSNQTYNEFMNGILPESASDFFFFDGEELDKYAGSYEEADADVKSAIETVLGIKEIQNTVQDLENWGKDHYEEKWQEKVEDVEELEELSNRIDEKVADIQAAQTELDSARTRLDNKETRLDQIEDDLAEIAGVEDKRERINEIEEELDGDPEDEDDDGLRGELEEKQQEQREIHTRLGPLMIGIGSQHVVDNYDVTVVSGLEDVIKYVLDEETCVCGADIGEDERETLEHNLAKVQNDEMQSVLELQETASNHLDCIIDGSGSPEDLSVREAKRKYVNLQDEISQLKNDIDDLESEKETLEGEIEDATINEEEAETLRNEKETLIGEIGGLENEIENLEEEIEDLEGDKRELEETRDSMDAVDDEEERYRTLMNLSDLCREAWENIRDEYVESQRQSVEKYASEIFRELTNKDEVYEGLKISDEYELDVKTVSGDRDIEEQNPSQGARQIIAYAFIAGLNKFTAREAPVVIDTPIGRLDPEHKDNLIDHLPNFRDQVVILYQPGELSERDIEKMEETVSHHLEIHQQEDDPESSTITKIESKSDLRRVLAE